jgi:hypothetical protein
MVASPTRALEWRALRWYRQPVRSYLLAGLERAEHTMLQGLDVLQERLAPDHQSRS